MRKHEPHLQECKSANITDGFKGTDESSCLSLMLLEQFNILSENDKRAAYDCIAKFSKLNQLVLENSGSRFCVVKCDFKPCGYMLNSSH